MIRGQKVTKINKTLMASIHNRFDLEVIDAKTGKVKQRAQAENVILDQLWSNWTSSWWNYLQYGSGSGTPSASDTALFNRKGSVYLNNGTTTEYTDKSRIRDGCMGYIKNATLSETAAVGVTITEVGLASGGSSGLSTHAMLEDMNGNPVSILKTSTDIINLYATVFFHWDLSGYNGVELLPDKYDYFPGVGFWADGTNRFSFSKESSLGLIHDEYVSPVYNKTTRTFSVTCPRLPVSDLNFGGFQYATWGPFVIKIPGPHRVIGESVATGNGTTKDFATDFDFPSNATVYVDGVPATNVTVSEEPVTRTNMGRYFRAIHEDSTDGNLIPASHTAPDNDIQTYNSSTWYTYGIGLFYYPYHDKYGITSYTKTNLASLSASNDLVHWETVYNKASNIDNAISKFKNYKYWKAVSDGSSYASHYWKSLTSSDLTGKNIHFEEAPASGAIITIDYDTPLVPKDENHVYDFILHYKIGPYISE